jgi:hypothetical protein
VKFRPADDPRQGDPNPGGPVEWADNWLSNTLAWASYRLTPDWCQDEDHWTSAVSRYLFTDCPCCLLFRGITLGALGMLILQNLLFILFALML